MFIVKRYYRPEWGDNWREHFTVDRINGFLGHELKFDGQKLVSNYLRVGYDPDGSWRIYGCGRTSIPPRRSRWRTTSPPRSCCRASSCATSTASTRNPSVKLVANCESMLFQRPDDAIHRGFDTQAEADIASAGHVPFELRAARPASRRERIVDHVVGVRPVSPSR